MHIVVVGGGIFGVTSAVELKQRGHEVTLLDRSDLPHDQAASWDISKLVRMDYGYDEEYMELMEEALRRWDRFNADLGEGAQIYHPDGILSVHRTPPKPGSFDRGCMDTLEKRGHKIDILDAKEIKRRFPQWNTTEYTHAYFNPQGGWVESGKATRAYCNLALRLGVKFMVGEVARLVLERTTPQGRPKVKGVVTSRNQTVLADLVIVAAGPWTPLILPHLSDVMWPTAQVVHHFLPSSPSTWAPPSFPPYLASVEETGFYGFPAHYSSDHRVKIGHHGAGVRMASLTTADLDRVLLEKRDASEAAFRAFIKASFPALLDAPRIYSRVCVYCDSLDGDFWIDRDTTFNGLVVAAGDSGHGFKFAPVLGEIIADVAENKPNKYRAKFAARTAAQSTRKEGARSTKDAAEALNTNTIPGPMRTKANL